jgi:hypothetical protein
MAPLTWVNSWLPVPLSPPAVPYSTVTAPASGILPMSSSGAPMTRSAKPSWLKSARMPAPGWAAAGSLVWASPGAAGLATAAKSRRSTRRVPLCVKAPGSPGLVEFLEGGGAQLVKGQPVGLDE